MLDAFALLVIFVLCVGGIWLLVAVGSLPGNIARASDHPQAAAINVLAWIGLLTAGVGWVIALVWAKTKPLNTDVFQTILHPVLLCWGNEDNMVSKDETQHAANMLPFGEFCLLTNSGHPIEKVDMELLKKEIMML